MKKLSFVSFVLLTILLLTQSNMDARPGGGSSYRSSSSSSRSSSSYSRSSSSSRSYSSGGTYYSSGSGGSELSDEEAKEIVGLIFGTVLSIMAIVLMTLGLVSNREEPKTLGERIGYLITGFIFMLLGAVLASLSKILIYLYLFGILSLPFIIFIYGIYRLKNGRETIYVAKGEKE